MSPHPLPYLLIVFLSGLHLLTETAFTVALPALATDLAIDVHTAEKTTSVYLFCFALGTVFWGGISDKIGRKPCLIAGLLIHALGGGLAYHSTGILQLYAALAVQAFGASIGGVLVQTVCRDCYHGAHLSRYFASIAVFLACFSFSGPFIGYALLDAQTWNYNAGLPLALAPLLAGCTAYCLQETGSRQKTVGWQSVTRRVLRDPYVWTCAAIIGAGDGILFGYATEAPFCLMERLGISSQLYSTTLACTALSGVVAGLIATYWNTHCDPEDILKAATTASTGFALLFLTIMLGVDWDGNRDLATWRTEHIAWLFVGLHMLLTVGVAVSITQALSLALRDYTQNLGIAASLLGGLYYTIAAACTWGISHWHQHHLWFLPACFFALCLIMQQLASRFVRPVAQH